MNSTNYTSAALNKKFDYFTVTDNFGNTYLFLRSGRKGYFNIAKCEILTNGHIDENDGLVPDAVPFHPEEVAYLIAEAEERTQQLERIESLLEEWITLRRSKSRRAKHRPTSLQKQEVAK